MSDKAMTTNQTIDGVPLAELKFDDRLFHVSKTWRGCGRGWVKFICDEGDGCVRVRCENGAVPIVKLGNLQTLAVTDEQELAEFYDELSSGNELARRALTHIKALHMANKPAAQPQGEPVAELQVAFFENGPMATINWFTPSAFEPGATKLYAEQPAPVAVVMPEFEPAFEKWWEEHGQYCRAGGGSYEKTFAYRAYEAALADVTRLNTK